MTKKHPNTSGDRVSVNWGHEGDVNGLSRCSIQYQNELFILGQVLISFIVSLFLIFMNKCEIENERGTWPDYDRQISKVVNCKLTRVGTLNRDMQYASCAMARGDIVMCFPRDAKKGCWKEWV